MATERPAKAKRILVVQDEPMIRMLLEDMLSELGYTVAAEAAGIEEALEATKERRLRPCDPRRRSQGPARLAGCRCPRLPAARRSFLPRAMARCPSPIRAGRC
jgi:CheY-like chemotaxis protein